MTGNGRFIPTIVMTGGWFIIVIPTLSDWDWVYNQTANHGAHGIYAWLCMYIRGPDHVRILPDQNNLPKKEGLDIASSGILESGR